MDKRTRQRLTGIVLLLILAAVLAPFVFRSPEQIRNALDMSIPAAPDYQAVTVEPVVSEEVAAEADERIEADRQAVEEAAREHLDDEAPADSGAGESALAESGQEPQETADAPVPPQEEPSDSPVLAGFVVQVGSYGNADNATSLVEKLKDAGYRAYSEADMHDGKPIHRVMVGPEIRKQDAEQTRQALADDSRFKLKGLVRIYAP